MSASLAAEALKRGDPAEALALLQSEVRAKPGDTKLRVFLSQLLMVLGQWTRALDQLDVLSTADTATVPMQRIYGDAIRCEVLRKHVFNGEKPPMVLGQPEQWLALLIESMLNAGRGEAALAEQLRVQAFEQSPAIAGSLNGRPFKWIADADSRIGPVLEAIINGKYYWAPFERFSRISFEAPIDLRDVVWMPATLEFNHGGSAMALVPTRYVESETNTDGQIQLSRKTVWQTLSPDVYRGLGQRILVTDEGETALMDVREIVLEPSATG